MKTRKLINVELSLEVNSKLEEYRLKNKKFFKTRKKLLESLIIQGLDEAINNVVLPRELIHIKGISHDYWKIQSFIEANALNKKKLIMLEIEKLELKLCYQPSAFISYWNKNSSIPLESFTIGRTSGKDGKDIVTITL